MISIILVQIQATSGFSIANAVKLPHNRLQEYDAFLLTQSQHKMVIKDQNPTHYLLLWNENIHQSGSQNPTTGKYQFHLDIILPSGHVS
jgi:hypothetical protein